MTPYGPVPPPSPTQVATPPFESVPLPLLHEGEDSGGLQLTILGHTGLAWRKYQDTTTVRVTANTLSLLY
jgi:hypothetical protein